MKNRKQWIRAMEYLHDYPVRHGQFQQASPDRLRTWWQHTHPDRIGSPPGCLITETAEVSRDKPGKDSRKNLIYCDLPKGTRPASWMWKFDAVEPIYPEDRRIWKSAPLDGPE